MSKTKQKKLKIWLIPSALRVKSDHSYKHCRNVGAVFHKKYICQINKEAEIQLLGVKTAGGNKINVIVYMSTCE